MASEALFLDTGGFFSIFATDCPHHDKAIEFMQNAARARRPTVTTDYVIQETATLFVARRKPRLVPVFFESIEQSFSLDIHWMTPEDFSTAQSFMLKHNEQPFSFTDCVSFVLMRELGLAEALATDTHFLTAGFIPLLADLSS